MADFSVFKRNPNHWDITSKGKREFAIRGEPGDVVLRDERGNEHIIIRFLTIITALAYVMEQYVLEQPSRESGQ